MFGISKSKVIEVINKYLLEPNTCDRRSYQINDLFFHNIDTEEKAYILGFIMADGSVTNNNDIQMCLQMEDKYILEQMLEAMDSNYKVTPIRENYCGFHIKSEQMVKDLNNLNVVQNKTLILRPPSNIPNNLYHHLVRGYFDGDGSIWFDKSTKNYAINFVGTLPVLEEFRDRMKWKHNTIRQANKGENKITMRMDYGGNRVVTRYLGQLYEDATIYLTRKYKKYLACKELMEYNLNKGK